MSLCLTQSLSVSVCVAYYIAYSPSLSHFHCHSLAVNRSQNENALSETESIIHVSYSDAFKVKQRRRFGLPF